MTELNDIQAEYDAIQAKIALLIVAREKIYIRLIEAVEQDKSLRDAG